MAESKLTPKHHRRAAGDASLGTKANPVAQSSNPAVARFKRGGAVGNIDMSKSTKGPSVSSESYTGVGALAAKDMRDGSLPKGDEFKKGGKAKHKYAKGGHAKMSSGGSGKASTDYGPEYAKGGSTTGAGCKGVGRW